MGGDWLPHPATLGALSGSARLTLGEAHFKGTLKASLQELHRAAPRSAADSRGLPTVEMAFTTNSMLSSSYSARRLTLAARGLPDCGRLRLSSSLKAGTSSNMSITQPLKFTVPGFSSG